MRRGVGTWTLTMAAVHLALFEGRPALYREDFTTCFFSNFTWPFHPIRRQTGSLRCHGWILRVEKIAFGVSRAPGVIWDPFSGHVCEPNGAK